LATVVMGVMVEVIVNDAAMKLKMRKGGDAE
jgi:hypothetical protein